MPLGQSPISSTSISGGSVLRSGVSFAAATGMSSSVSLGSVTASGVIRGSYVTGVEAVLNTPVLGDVKTNGAAITLYLQQYTQVGMTVGAHGGIVTDSDLVVSGVSSAVVLGGGYIANGVFVSVSGVLTTSAVGTTGQTEHLRWANITPTSSPGWAEIKVPVE